MFSSTLPCDKDAACKPKRQTSPLKLRVFKALRCSNTIFSQCGGGYGSDNGDSDSGVMLVAIMVMVIALLVVVIMVTVIVVLVTLSGGDGDCDSGVGVGGGGDNSVAGVGDDEGGVVVVMAIVWLLQW